MAEIRLGARDRQPFVEAIQKAEELVRQKNLATITGQVNEATFPEVVAA
jgi:hypothetical protein